MLKKYTFVPLLFGVFLYAHNSFANTLTLNQVLKSAARAYPKIIQAQYGIKMAQAKTQKSLGAFDTVISQDLYTRPNGYYDGTYSDTKIMKPLQDSNAQVYTGYRTENGSFPIYESDYETNSQGEYYIGAKFSLLRDRLTDKQRTSLAVSRLQETEQDVKLMLNKLDVQKNAIQKYWTWVAAGHQYYIYKELFELTQNIQEYIKKKVDAGALAEVYLKENQQYLLKRQADMAVARADMMAIAQELSLYYRDKNGNPVIASLDNLPKNMPDLFTDSSDNILPSRILKHPIFQTLQIKKNILEQKKRLSENDLLPYLDVNLKLSQDYGTGSKTRDEKDVSALINFKIPLYRNVAKADKAYAEAQIIALNYEEKLQFELLNIAIRKTVVQMKNQKRFLSLTNQEYELSKLMLDVEMKRFEAGVSDFFTLNQREEDIVKVKLRRLKAQETYLKLLAEVKSLTAYLEKPFEI